MFDATLKIQNIQILIFDFHDTYNYNLIETSNDIYSI